MADKQEILRRAKELGAALASNPKIQGFLDARDAVDKDTDAQKLLEDYQAQIGKVQRLAAERKPIEPEDKRRVAELEGRLASHASLKQFMRYQADYYELMNSVHQAMDQAIAASRGASAS